MNFYLYIIIISIFFSFSIQIELLSALDLNKIRADILTNHNYHRKRHQVDKLTRDSTIEGVAQSYSEYLAQIDQMVHSDNGYGENLYYCYSSAGICVTGEKASQSWYNEVSKYNFDNPGFSSETGHFTPLVWKGSQKIGCGAACNSKNKCYVSCNYYPPGNYQGQFKQNVFRKIDIPDGDETNPDEGNGGNGDNVLQENEDGGMSTAGKVFLAIFIILIILVIAFSIFHFVIRKRRFRDIKNYFTKAY